MECICGNSSDRLIIYFVDDLFVDDLDVCGGFKCCGMKIAKA